MFFLAQTPILHSTLRADGLRVHEFQLAVCFKHMKAIIRIPLGWGMLHNANLSVISANLIV